MNTSMKKMAKWQKITIKALYEFELKEPSQYYNIGEICKCIVETFGVTVSRSAVIIYSLDRLIESDCVEFRSPMFSDIQ